MGHPVKGKNRGGQLRALFAKGVLRGHGKGKGRKVTKVGSKSVATIGAKTGRFLKSSVASGGAKRGYGKAKNKPGQFQRTAIGGKTAVLRKGASPKAKVDHSGTRAARIARAKLKLAEYSGTGRAARIKNQTAEIQRKIGSSADGLSKRQTNQLRLETYKPAGRRRERLSNAGRVSSALAGLKRQQRATYEDVNSMSRGAARRAQAEPARRKRYATLKAREERVRKAAKRLGVII